MDSLIHSLRDITIRRISVSEMNNNVYLLTSKASGAQLLIDAADDLPAIQQMIEDSAADTTATPKTGPDRHDAPALGPRPRASRVGGSYGCEDLGRSGRRRCAARAR
jgi:hypothetical protein